MESSSSNNSSANSNNQNQTTVNSANTTNNNNNKSNPSTPSSTCNEGSLNSLTTDDREICLEIAPTTGGTFDFNVHCHESIDNLKKNIAKKLKVSKEQICLLHRDRLLQTGMVRDYGLADGSRISLVPSVETGLLTQRPEQSVLEALEGLNESQVGDFLSGKSPLNLTMRLGDHVMLIQLQLSKGTSAENSNTSGCGSSSNVSAINTTPIQNIQASESPRQQPPSPQPETNRSATNASGNNSGSLAEASRNLTNTLKKLSNHVTRDESITNHMQHHGKGVYSGTFSGTLNPALQDGLGKPRKHVSTIVHILNDLLGGMEPKGGKRGASAEGSASSGQSGSGTQTKKPKLMTRLEKERENEELRAKMEKIKESLRMRKEKLINK